jgi:hypothetical protein
MPGPALGMRMFPTGRGRRTKAPAARAPGAGARGLGGNTHGPPKPESRHAAVMGLGEDCVPRPNGSGTGQADGRTKREASAGRGSTGKAATRLPRPDKPPTAAGPDRSGPDQPAPASPAPAKAATSPASATVLVLPRLGSSAEGPSARSRPAFPVPRFCGPGNCSPWIPGASPMTRPVPKDGPGYPGAPPGPGGAACPPGPGRPWPRPAGAGRAPWPGRAGPDRPGRLVPGCRSPEGGIGAGVGIAPWDSADVGSKAGRGFKRSWKPASGIEDERIAQATASGRVRPPARWPGLTAVRSPPRAWAAFLAMGAGGPGTAASSKLDREATGRPAALPQVG